MAIMLICLHVFLICGGELYGWPKMHSMSGLSLVLQRHLWVPHVHGSNHVGFVFS